MYICITRRRQMPSMKSFWQKGASEANRTQDKIHLLLVALLDRGPSRYYRALAVRLL